MPELNDRERLALDLERMFRELSGLLKKYKLPRPVRTATVAAMQALRAVAEIADPEVQR